MTVLLASEGFPSTDGNVNAGRRHLQGDRLNVSSGMSDDFFQVILVPSGFLAAVLQADDRFGSGK
jgi:hypothetical protein